MFSATPSLMVVVMPPVKETTEGGIMTTEQPLNVG